MKYHLCWCWWRWLCRWLWRSGGRDVSWKAKPVLIMMLRYISYDGDNDHCIDVRTLMTRAMKAISPITEIQSLIHSRIEVTRVWIVCWTWTMKQMSWSIGIVIGKAMAYMTQRIVSKRRIFVVCVWWFWERTWHMMPNLKISWWDLPDLWYWCWLQDVNDGKIAMY